MDRISETATEILRRLAELKQVSDKYQTRIDSLVRSSRTAKLWIQYQNYVDNLKLFICAERTGNWSLHLLALSTMINLFAATGHINYAKSARLQSRSS